MTYHSKLSPKVIILSKHIAFWVSHPFLENVQGLLGEAWVSFKKAKYLEIVNFFYVFCYSFED
jgi:hypothetical protein